MREPVDPMKHDPNLDHLSLKRVKKLKNINNTELKIAVKSSKKNAIGPFACKQLRTHRVI